MLEALRVQRGAVASELVEGSRGVPLAASVTVPAPATAPAAEPEPAVTLSRAVLDACERHAYGNRDEMRANRGVARVMAENGSTDAEIIAALREGAAMPTWAAVAG